jgi:hypothetical protein
MLRFSMARPPVGALRTLASLVMLFQKAAYRVVHCTLHRRILDLHDDPSPTAQARSQRMQAHISSILSHGKVGALLVQCW